MTARSKAPCAACRTPEDAVAAVMAARSAAELFGGDDDPARAYHRLARLLHPDLSPGTAAAFARLATLWSDHTKGTRVGPYRVGPPLHRGGTAMLYPADDDLVLKLPRNPGDNHLLRREAEALRTIAAEGDPRLLPYIPRLVRSFRHRAAGRERQANVISRAPEGFVPLSAIGRRLDPRDVAWIWRRLLVAVGLGHRAGLSHGAVLPRHVLVHPLDHGLILVDWCRAGDDPARDIEQLSTVVADLLDNPPRSMRAFVDGCRKCPPRDAWALLRELDDLLEDLYGPRKYRPLEI